MSCLENIIKIKKIGLGKLKAKINLRHNSITKVVGKSDINLQIKKEINIISKLNLESKISANETVSFGLIENLSSKSDIRSELDLDGVLKSRIFISGNLFNKYTNKLSGNGVYIYLKQNCLEKLYPTQDIVTSLNNTYFVNENLGSGDLYQSVDEGIFSKSYDEKVSYIQPSSIYTEGSFRYRCKVSPALVRPEESLLLIRASAPTKTYSSNLPPVYKLSNITLKNSNDDLIIKYEDVIVRGDADYENADYKNFSTYIAKPSINYSNQNTWKDNYPDLGSGLLSDSYTLNIDFDVECLDDPFNTGFDFGYSEGCELQTLEPSGDDYLAIDGSPLSTRTQGYSLNPNNTIRITAIELCNSGSRITFNDNYLPFYNEVASTGFRITRSIYPSQVLLNNYSTTIYPEENSVWISSPDIEFNTQDNTTIYGTNLLKDYLRDDAESNYITLDTTSNIADSGKLKLVFSHEPPKFVSQYTGGAFEFGALTENKNFNTARWDTISEIDNYFTIDKIDLIIVAKKSINSRDYVIDAVGYSDDKILCSTPKIGGFLQNVENSGGYLPVSSGFNSINDLGISSETLSDKYQFYSVSGTNNSGGDHYALSTYPIINSTEFQEYVIPLRIYEDSVELGQSTDYSMSSYFEKLYLDLFPIPSGASIAHIKLVISYKPTNALKLHTIGQGSDELYRRLLSLNLIDDYISSSGSSISNIPHAYAEDEPSIKYNYSTRWNGVQGSVVAGPFDPNKFDFSYYNPEMIKPFLNGYFSFNHDSGNSIISDYSFEKSRLATVVSGSYIGNYSKTKNIGLRFNSSSLFSSATPYKTIDWTSITGYENHELYNRISDSFDNAVRVSGNLGYINFGNIEASSGFAILTRFSPDINMSGVGFNLWNSGTIFSKYDSGQNLEFALGYNNGKLKAYARTDSGSIITIEDTEYYYEYTYPLSVMLSYNENNDKKLRLFTSGVKAESSSFNLYSGISNLTFGYSSGSGIGINAFLTDIGISTGSGTNILSTGTPLKLQKQILYNNFLNDKLYSFIDNEIDDWHIGDFKICSFNQDYDRFTKRVGSDFLIHNIKSDGSGYFNITNTTLPSSISSGVSYHTQIENDFLRFYLEDVENVHEGFFSANPRISKNLPRDYDFAEKALVVESIIDHFSYNNIIWPDGKIGPKLIVSLYTKNKNPKSAPDKINWGLINRHSHYLKPSGCYQKLSSIFNYNNLIDTSEEWANFDSSISNLEFDHKYYSTDINDMFLQYDLVYPSGSPYESSIKLHSAQIKLQDAFVKPVFFDSNPNINLYVFSSGEQFNSLNICSFGHSGISVIDNSQFGLSLYINNNTKLIENSGLNIYSFGSLGYNEKLNLSLTSISGIVDNINGNSLYNYNYEFNPSGNGFNLFCTSESGNANNINLFCKNFITANENFNSCNLISYSDIKVLKNSESSLSTYIRGSIPLTNFFPESNINLYVKVDEKEKSSQSSINLFVANFVDPGSTNSYLTLHSINEIEGKYESISYFRWDSDNTGSDIEQRDNYKASLAANDEIRGIETICYGKCGNKNSCVELEIKTHDIIWNDEKCIDGGIARGYKTYTNLDIGYSGNYYGIRKLGNLIPNHAYDIKVFGKTPEENNITIPYIIEESEYGYNNNANYSGIKLIADDPYITNGRNEKEEYGKSIDIFNDLMVIGTPHKTLYDSGNYQLVDAGSLMVYRRQAQPSGHTWSYHKGAWNLETQLNLPSSILRDYYIDSTSLLDGVPIVQRNWFVGQEGRQLGHSVAIAKRNNKEIIVAGGPSARFSRTFDQPTPPSGVDVAILIFTDSFDPSININPLINNVLNKNALYSNISDPPINFNINLLIFETIKNTPRLSKKFIGPDFFHTFIINKHLNEVRNSQDFITLDNNIFNDIIASFNQVYPYDESKKNNNIPELIGIFIDKSRSMLDSRLNSCVQPAVDNFIEYYKNYSFNNGLKNLSGLPANSYILKKEIPSENWVSESKNILDEILDSGNLISTDAYKLFSNNISISSGPPYNIPPSSGGAVYIFENNNNSWELKQTINSPTISRNIKPDRFGHALDISKDGQTLIIGSPYINEAVQIFEYNNSKNQYLKKLSYSYSDIQYNGTWRDVVEKFAPTSRLGYSVATNEDGTIIAFGSPTDSLDEYNDTNTYYTPNRPDHSTWHSYINAGSVRVLSGKKYTPHNKFYIFNKFGNINKNLSGDQEKFDLTKIIGETIHPVEESSFDDTEIPEDAGTLFLINPYIDAGSNEIITKIKNWLELGDRNLVLVGDDPVWENNGIYSQSNNLINKILETLNSKMRLVPARNKEESLYNGPISNNKNVFKSFIPDGSISYTALLSETFASGVADIRIYSPGTDVRYDCDNFYKRVNNKCEMPLTHMGDLRSQWKVLCDPTCDATYPMNWPMYFGVLNPAAYNKRKPPCICSDEPWTNSENYPPVPLLVAGGFSPQLTIVDPAVPATSSIFIEDYITTKTSYSSQTIYSNSINNMAFMWDSSSGNYISINRNVGLLNSDSKFYDPDIENNFDGLLKATTSETLIEKTNTSSIRNIASEKTYFCVEEKKNNSSIVLLVNDKNIQSLSFFEDSDLDKSINFYTNLIAQKDRTVSIGFLNELTNKNSFDSYLDFLFVESGEQIDFGISLDELIRINYDVCWILDPIVKPTPEQINKIKLWLSNENKKLILSYSTLSDNLDVSIAKNISYICEELGLTIKPLFLNIKNTEAIYPIDTDFPSRIIRSSSNIKDGLYNDTIDDVNDNYAGNIESKFVPIYLGSGNEILYLDSRILDASTINIDLINESIFNLRTGVTKIDFGVLPGSGYRVFFDYISNSDKDKYPINIKISNASPIDNNRAFIFNNQIPKKPQLREIHDSDNFGNKISIGSDFISNDLDLTLDFQETNVGIKQTKYIDIKIPSGLNYISIYFDGNIYNNIDFGNTVNFLAVSGFMLPVETFITSTIIEEKTPIYNWQNIPEKPEKITIIPSKFGPISSLSSKYCSSDSECSEKYKYALIEDGPVVMAQELIPLGSNGFSKSRITLISDSSMIQGPNAFDINGNVRPAVRDLLRSLYPQTNFPTTDGTAKIYDVVTRIMNPEKGSPVRFYNAFGKAGLSERFTSTSSGIQLSLLKDTIPEYDTFGSSDNKRPLPISIGLPPEFIECTEGKNGGCIPHERETYLQYFQNVCNIFDIEQSGYGSRSKFKQIINSKYYEDASVNGGMPQIMIDTDHDYLDFDYFKYGYPGDLFGYSISISNNKLVIGCPFGGYETENILNWENLVSGININRSPSGIKVGQNGGAGVVYIYENTGSGTTPYGNNIPWQLTRKLKPSSINIGQDIVDLDSFENYFGSTNYSLYDFDDTKINDQFGHNVSINSDILCIGAPGHDFQNYYEDIYNSGIFVRKEFNKDFDIPKRNIYDLGDLSTRQSIDSGNVVLNNGAIYIYENRLSNVFSKDQTFILIDKIVPQGYNSRLQKSYIGAEEIVSSGSENDRFGSIFCLDKALRSDSDYTIGVGVPDHKFANSVDSILYKAGAVYTYDLILRNQGFISNNNSNWINAKVFGNGYDSITLNINNENQLNKTFISSGIIFTDQHGEIFIEISGQDTQKNSLISNRPFISKIEGTAILGYTNNKELFLHSIGNNLESSSSLNLFNNASNTAIVYNNLGLYEYGVIDIVSGVPNGLFLYTDCPSGIIINESGLILHASGTGFSAENLNMRIRGK